MKILYIITQADGGGAQKYTLTLAKHFKGAIAAGTESSDLFSEAAKAGITAFPLKHLKRKVSIWNDFLAVWEIRRLLGSYRPDIVHLNSSKAGVLGSFASIGMAPKVIFTAHGFVFNEPLPKATKAIYLALEKAASFFRDYIIAVSEADRRSALKYRLVGKNKISTIHNGLPPLEFLPKQKAREEMSLDQNNLIFGTVAGLYKTKGLDILIEAVSMLKKDLLAGTQFVIIGDGPEKTYLQSKIQELKLESEIRLKGKIGSAARLLKAFDVFVLPSRKEGFPYTLLEAMQAGLPIIASSAGGNGEALGEAGTLFQPENPQDLSGSLASIIEQARQQNGALAEMAKKSQKRSLLFTEAEMVGQTKAIYAETLSA